MKHMKLSWAVMAVVLFWFVGCSKDDDPKPAPAAFSVDKSAIDFVEVEIGSSKKVKLTITNTGEEELVLKDYSLSGGDASGFSVNFSESEVTLPAEGTFEMAVNFSPMEEGAKSSVLTIVSNIGEHKIDLKGKGVPAPVAVFEVDLASKDFGDVETGGQLAQVFTVTNTGNADLNLMSYTVDGDAIDSFQVNFNAQTMAPGATYGLEVVFMPQSAGVKTAVLTIVSNIGEHKIDLKGKGVPAPVAVFEVDLASKDFGDVETGGQLAQVFTVTNTGNADLNLMSYAVDGDAIDSFQINFNAQTMAPGATYGLEVVFMPQSAGVKTAVITLATNVGDFTIDLQGNGVVLDPVVSIPDANFKAVLLAHGSAINGTNISKIDTNDDGEIQVSEAESYTGTISSSQRDVSDLTGIEAFTSLTELRCDNNPLTQLDLSNNVDLKVVMAYRCGLTSVDVSQSTALETLHLDDNQLSNLNVGANTNLKILRAQRNGLTALDLTQNIALETLLLNDNALSVLDVSNSPKLNTLMAQRNQLTSLNISQNPSLELLYLDDNQLSALDVSSSVNLRLIWAQLNSLTTLDISNNTMLEEVRCGMNQLSSMDLSQNTALKLFYSDANQLSTLDLSQNTLLQSLSISGNLLTSLDTSQNPALELLTCSRNNLSILDVSNNIGLKTFFCDGNQLSILNLANGNNSAIEYMGATNNPNLTCIQIDAGFTPPTGGTWTKDDTAGYSSNCP